jgi:Na+/H+ antiporter NhaD/arsenite permease-like protein
MSWMPDTTIVAAWLIFLATYVVVALGKIPVYRIDRAGAALLGGSLMVATGVLSLEEAYRAIDFNTIVLLLGMMIVVANLRLSGFFRVITHWIAGHVKRPIMAMAATLAGNFTLVGSVANLIVAQRAKARGVELDFWTYRCTTYSPDYCLWTFVALREVTRKT